MFKQTSTPINSIFIFSPFFSSKTISFNRFFSKSSIITNIAIWLFKNITFANILTSTISTYLLPFIISKSKRANNIPITKFLNKINFKRSRTTTITMRSKYSNSFNYLLIPLIIWTTFIITVSSKFKFSNSMLANIRIINNIIHYSLINKRGF